MDITLIAFLLTLGLVARVTHLFVDDAIFKPLREWLGTWSSQEGIKWDNDKSKWTGIKLVSRAKRWFAELLSCVHCTSVWVSAAALFALYHGVADHKWYLYVAAAATLSYLTGLLATWRYAKESL